MIYIAILPSKVVTLWYNKRFKTKIEMLIEKSLTVLIHNE